MTAEAPGHTLDATALVYEVYLRLVGDQQFDGRGHFFAAAAEAMRRILVEAARRKQAQKHGGGRVRVALEGVAELVASDDRMVELDSALARLADEEPEVAAVVNLRYFAGLTTEQVADSLGISVRTATGPTRRRGFSRSWGGPTDQSEK